MISILIPVYNQGEELKNCLNAIYAQTTTDYEIIIVNDRSTEKLSSIIRRQKEMFGNKLSLYHNQVNHGPPYTRNKAFRLSRGEFIIFCDADVIMKSNMLDIMLENLRVRDDVSYAYSSFIWAWKKFKLWPYDEAKLKEMLPKL